MTNLGEKPRKTGKERRSQRVYIGVDVAVRWDGVPAVFPPNLTRTIAVSPHGALLSLSAKVTIGQRLMLKNIGTQEESPCRVVGMSLHEKAPAVAVDFTEPCPRFWRIAFPPENWTTRSPEAKGHTPQLVPRPRSDPHSRIP
jgi:hypothetical protein